MSSSRPLPPRSGLTGLGRSPFTDLYLHCSVAMDQALPWGDLQWAPRCLGPQPPTSFPWGFLLASLLTLSSSSVGHSPALRPAPSLRSSLSLCCPIHFHPPDFLGNPAPRPTPAHALGSTIGQRWCERVTEATAVCPVNAALSPTHHVRLPRRFCFPLSPQKANGSFWERPTLPLPCFPVAGFRCPWLAASSPGRQRH